MTRDFVFHRLSRFFYHRQMYADVPGRKVGAARGRPVEGGAGPRRPPWWAAGAPGAGGANMPTPRRAPAPPDRDEDGSPTGPQVTGTDEQRPPSKPPETLQKEGGRRGREAGRGKKKTKKLRQKLYLLIRLLPFYRYLARTRLSEGTTVCSLFI